MNRDVMLEAAAKTPEWDLIIIGGGASGLWCAVDSASRGYKTLLLEMGDFAEGSSSRSTKLFHGGLRYLKQGRLGLIHEGLIERGYLAKNAPHLFTARPFLLPFYNRFDKPYYKLGMMLYDFLAGKLVLKKHRLLNKEESLRECPTLRQEGLRGGAVYYDGQFDDARFAIELAKTAANHGATLLNYCKVTAFTKNGVIATDLNTGKSVQATGKAIINATGIFTDEIRKLDNRESLPVMVLSRGSHIIVDKKFLAGETALIVPKTGDKRVIFVIPWKDKVLIGTTEAVVQSPSNNPKPSPEEIEFLLEHAKMILNPYPKKEDILSCFAGIRPLVKASHKNPSSKLSRNHEIIVSRTGLITITGGKWTTGRRMAEDTVNKAFKKPRPCITKTLEIHRSIAISDLIRSIQVAVKEEMALKPSDILARRLGTLFLDSNQAIQMAPEVIRLMAHYLKKDSEWENTELKNFTEYAKSYCT